MNPPPLLKTKRMARHWRHFLHFSSLAPNPTGPSRRRPSSAIFSALSRPMASEASWSCSKCTFLNPPTQKSACQICLSSPPPTPPPVSAASSSFSAPQWACKACTFLNYSERNSCEICGKGGSPAGEGRLDERVDEGHDGHLVGSVFFPLRPCKRKVEDFVDLGASDEGQRLVKKPEPTLGDSIPDSALTSYKILSYNVWFREDLELHQRMKALGDLIQQYAPDLISFQEVTSNIYDIFKQSKWWKVYKCSVTNEMAAIRPYFCMQLSRLPVKSFTCKPFMNSMMGRELCIADINIKKKLLFATTHLESPCPGPPTWDQMFSKERVAQAKEAVKLLEGSPNIVFGGDMNWDEKHDGAYPLTDGWVDAWKELKPGENGWTYDTRSNTMLSGNRTLQKRLDRFVCKLKDFKMTDVQMIGKDAIPGLSYIKEKKVRNQVRKLELPVMPSDHYGLLLTITET